MTTEVYFLDKLLLLVFFQGFYKMVCVGRSSQSNNAMFSKHLSSSRPLCISHFSLSATAEFLCVLFGAKTEHDAVNTLSNKDYPKQLVQASSFK